MRLEFPQSRTAAESFPLPEVRVLHVISGLARGGAELTLLKVLRLSHGEGFAHEVLSLTDVDDLRSEIEALGIPVHRLGVPLSTSPFRGLARARKVVRSVAPDVIQGWMYHGNLVASLVSAGSDSAPVLWNVRHTPRRTFRDYRARTGMVIRAGAWFSGRPHAIVYCGQRCAGTHERLGYRGPGVVIRNGVDTDRYLPSDAHRLAVRRELGTPDDHQLVGLVARYHPMKGHGTFLEAVRLLGNRRPAMTAVLVGRGLDRTNTTLVQRVRALGIEKRVRLLGEREDTARVTAALDVACSASTFGEGLSNTMLEAMASGVPCIATDVGDSADLIRGAGSVVSPGDAAALGAAISELLDMSKDERQRIGAVGRQRAVQHFSLQEMMASYRTLWNEAAVDGGSLSDSKGTDPRLTVERGVRAARMRARSVRNVLYQSIRPQRLSVMAGKVKRRFADAKGLLSKEDNLRWLRSVSEELEPVVGGLAPFLWAESKAFADRLDQEANTILAGIEHTLGGGGCVPLLYFLCRYLSPVCVLETGVAAGYSSAALLSALRANGRGRLYSSDFPYVRLPRPERFIGVLVEPGLRGNWELHTDGDEVNLPTILEGVESVDLFHYDSDKSYSGRQLAMSLVEPKTHDGTVIVMDDIEDNSFFHDVVQDCPRSRWRVFRFRGKYVGVVGDLSARSAPMEPNDSSDSSRASRRRTM